MTVPSYTQIKELAYNLPGYGLLKVSSYPYCQAFYDFLRSYHYDRRFHHTNHLGSLRDIFQGLHNTRYEYIFLQWTFISELSQQDKTKGLGLSKEIKEFGKLPGFDKYPSGAEVLQCLALLTNMGHLPGTFAASRAWLHRIEKHKETYSGFKNGLAIEDRLFLKQVLSRFDIYRVHLLNAAFLLQRYKRFGGATGGDFVSFGEKLVRSYFMNYPDEKLAIKNIWLLYKVIRQVSYLILDCHYSPVPFSLDLSSIILNFTQLFQEFPSRESVFRATLNRLNVLLQDSLYMSGDSLLAQSRTTEQILKRFEDQKSLNFKWDGITNIKHILEPYFEDLEEIPKIFSTSTQVEFLEPDWDSNKMLCLNYDNIRGFEHDFPQNTVDFEINGRKQIGQQFCRVAAQFDPSKNLFRVAYSLLRNIADNKALIKSLKIANAVFEFEKMLHSNYREILATEKHENYQEILRFLLRATCGWDYQVQIEDVLQPGIAINPFLLGSGSKSIAHEITNYIKKIKNQAPAISPDKIHEFETVYQVLSDFKFRGKIICFLGSSKIKKDGVEKAEFDGVVFFPSADYSSNFAFIVEAKNRKHAHTRARRALEEKLEQLCLPRYVMHSIQEVPKKGAFASLRIQD